MDTLFPLVWLKVMQVRTAYKSGRCHGLRQRQTFQLVLCSLLLVFAGFNFASNRLADQRDIFFDRLGTADGLSQSSITAITQDQSGFIWIGTQEGLNRYDGYGFQTFYHKEGDAGSLSHEYIRSLLSDSQGRIWVGTNEGLNIFDEASKSFSSFNLNSGDLEAVITVYDLLEDRDGNIWVGTNLGLSRLSRNGQLTNLRHQIADGQSLGKGNVRTLFQSSDGAIWVGTEQGGLNKIDSDTGEIMRFEHDPNNVGSLSNNFVRDIIEDDEGKLWIATYRGGVSIFDPEQVSFRRMSFDQDNGNTLGSNRVRTLLKDENGDIWLGTNGGLNLWHASSGDFFRYVNDVTNVRSVSNNTIFSLFQDRGGVIWVGTFDGVNKWNGKIQTFPHFRQSSDPSSLASNSTTSFAEAPNHDVWIGTVSGVTRWSATEGAFRTFSVDKFDLAANRVMSLISSNDELWVGTMAGGINVISDEEIVAILKNDPDDKRSISSNAISRMYQDNEGRIWAATYGGGVNLYLGEGKFRRFPDASNPRGAFSDLRTLDIARASDDTFWIATYGGGVVVLDSTNGDALSLRHNPDDRTSLSSDNVISLLRTEDTIWVGTRNRGLNRYNPGDGKFRRYTKSQGLLSDSVYGMLEDAEGNIWISGGKGLSVLDPKTDIFRHYDSSHGLQANDFNSGAYLKLSDGSFIFGGNNGFNAFDPVRIGRNQYVPPIRLTSFSKFNKAFGLPAPIDRTDLIELDYSDFVIGFEFSALDYTAPQKNQFKYKLEGFDPDWVDSAGTRQVTYTNLDAGSYLFRVKGSNNDGIWNEEGTQVKLVVAPPLWATWWAYVIYLLLFVFALYQLLRANALRQRREAEKEYSDRLQLYIESLEEATDCVLIADNNGKLLYANNAIQSILGHTPTEALGRQLVSVVFENERDAELASSALEEHGRYHGEVTHQPEGEMEPRTTDVTIAAVRELSEKGSAYVSIARDITNRKKTEAELQNHRRNLEYLVAERTRALEIEIVEHEAAEDDLANSLQEKELLLKEVHHRVKNNMQVISSLLNIQAETAGNDDFTELLGASQQRIKSMSLIHENLYQSDNLLEIDFEDYITVLANSLCRFYAVPGVDVLLDIKVDNVSLDIETAVPCGLIINEIISNSLKHAFKDQKGTGTISVNFRTNGCKYVLDIKDDGKGLPADFRLEDCSSMGMEIVSILTEQLDGKIKVDGTNGAAFTISFVRKIKNEA